MKSQLIHMRDKLNNINKRNRSIRTLRLAQKWNFDLTSIDKLSAKENSESIVKKIVEQKSKGKITIVAPSMDNDLSLKLSKKLTDLYRQIKAMEDETGVHDFYLGYPFVAGTLSDGTFIQAPLFLYPIRLEKDQNVKQNWILQLDEGGPQLNRTLFLAIKKLNKINFTEEFFEEAREKGKNINLQEVLPFLSDNHLTLQYNSTGIVPLKEYKSQDIPHLANLTLLEYAVIGDFPQGGSSIVRDYEDLIELSESSNLSLVGEMITSGDEKIIEEGILTNGIEQNDGNVNKDDVMNLLQTDGSQEAILREARIQKGLVIQGPPGTGKSQVIVNLITDSLYQNKKVLVVCQKRAALDVVYQRMHGLGLSENVALIHDEKLDRKALYQKIHAKLEQNEIIYKEALEEMKAISSRLSAKENTLNNIAKALYEKQSFGYKLYELYGLAKPVVDSNEIIKLNNVIDKLSKDSLREVGESVRTYGEWYALFGMDDYTLKNRENLAGFTLDKKVQIIESLEHLISKAKEAVNYINDLNHEKITPAYTWEVLQRLERIYPDLDDSKKRTLQNIRILWWTTFSGKAIIQELLNSEKFKGVNSTEWIKIKQSLIIMHDLGNITKDMSEQISILNMLVEDKVVKNYQSRIAEGDIPIEELERILDVFRRDFDELKEMDRYWNELNEETKVIINLLKSKESKSEKTLSQYWKEVLYNSTFNYWIEAVESKYTDVQMISSKEFMRFRNEFATLIEEKRNAAAKYLIHNLSVDVHAIQQKKSTRELKHQTGKKRQVWPLRKLVNEFADLGLIDILPVWLASPEMVSSMFPLKEGLFDLVIFDEASQMTVETGMPSVFRGKQVIVAGDEMQLQPSNMFRAGYADDADDDERYDTDESVSLLNLAKRRFESRTLQWHYRSKYEELINFSNHAFYNGYIQIAPNVTPFKEPPAIRWEKVNGRWIDQSNEVEAIVVVNQLKEILQSNPEKTVGIITFNAKQQSKVQDIIDSRLAEDSEFSVLYNELMSRSLDERLFVKNIENVQGDERDIIIFSIGYAKNEEGKVYNRFGSLNQSGGENRLNVAVTRAKEGIIVVSSIEPEELNVSNTAERGPKLLKEYLKYARAVSNGKIEEVNAVIQEINETVNTHVVHQSLHFDSPFEEQVYVQLRNLGYEVVTQVGMSGYRIDMAIVDPNNKSRYILGIECDGAMYHSSPSAKERDVYRQKYLESRGWTIERIWSRNWWRNPQKEIERIDECVKKLARKTEIGGEISKERSNELVEV